MFVCVSRVQIEVHPYLTRPALVAECEARGILVQAFSPLVRAHRMNDPKLLAIAARHGKSPAQILIRWSLQKGPCMRPCVCVCVCVCVRACVCLFVC